MCTLTKRWADENGGDRIGCPEENKYKNTGTVSMVWQPIYVILECKHCDVNLQILRWGRTIFSVHVTQSDSSVNYTPGLTARCSILLEISCFTSEAILWWQWCDCIGSEYYVMLHCYRSPDKCTSPCLGVYLINIVPTFFELFWYYSPR